MKVLILGIDGYIGFPLAIHLRNKGHLVFGLDNFSRRKRVHDVGSESLTPIMSVNGRILYLEQTHRALFECSMGIDHHNELRSILNYIKPDAIIHLAEQPSAPWSMVSVFNADETQQSNVIGTLHLLWAMKEQCPKAHLIKLGTMGEYGTPNCDIPEGRVPDICEGDVAVEKHFAEGEMCCPMKGLLFPRIAGSFYHLSKVHDTHNIEFACRTWGLRSTDIMQGVVFGLNECDCTEELTRFDYDEYFGTVINRFCAQAIINHPLTIYGEGGQTRGFLTLKDSLQCLTIALDNPPHEGEYRTFNQFENIYTINKLAEIVADAHHELRLDRSVHLDIQHLPNPRKESEHHYYNPTHQKLFDLGYVPTRDIEGEILKLIKSLLPFSSRVKEEVIMPRTQWR